MPLSRCKKIFLFFSMRLNGTGLFRTQYIRIFMYTIHKYICNIYKYIHIYISYVSPTNVEWKRAPGHGPWRGPWHSLLALTKAKLATCLNLEMLMQQLLLLLLLLLSALLSFHLLLRHIPCRTYHPAEGFRRGE